MAGGEHTSGRGWTVGSGQEELPRRGESAEGGVEPETRRFPEAKGRDRGRRVWSGRRPAARVCLTFAEKCWGSEWDRKTHTP